MKRFLPYFKYFKPVKWQLLGSVLSGLVYAAATGAGLPLAAKVVFPLIFKDDQLNLGEGEPENSFFVEGHLSAGSRAEAAGNKLEAETNTLASNTTEK